MVDVSICNIYGLVHAKLYYMTPSLGGIGLFRGKLVNLCGKLTQMSMNAHGAST
jgi:hypothetical protein